MKQHLTTICLLFSMVATFFCPFLLSTVSFGKVPSWLGEKAGERKVVEVCGIAFAFRWCPSGIYWRGSPSDEPGHEQGEQRHLVTLTQGFWILETEVTQAMYFAITGESPSEFRGDQLPVDSVSWFEAVAFCGKFLEALQLPSDYIITLPTEAQWEYACRAGTESPWYGPLETVAWSGELTDSGTTHPVGTKEPNAWGLFDTHGNLWEWCADLYQDYSDHPVTDPIGPTLDQANSDVRIDRGGCWDSDPSFCRSAHRGVYSPDRRSRYVGFRVVILKNRGRVLLH